MNKNLQSITYLLMILIILSACSDPSLSKMSSDSVIFCSESDPGTFNPQLNTDATTTDASAHQIYNRLIDFDPVTGKLIPALSSSWLVSEDGLTYTFQLRQNVHFHTTSYFSPSRTFNADDVIFSINRWRLNNHPYHNVSGGSYPYFQSLNLADYIDTVKRVNGYRVEVTLNRRDSAFLANLATDFSIILSAEYGNLLLSKGIPENIDSKPIGTGPFKYENYVKGQVIYYKKHNKYWKSEYLVSNLIYDITPKSALRLAKLVTGECDVIALLSQSDLDIVRESNDLMLDQAPSLNVGYWAFNTRKKPFDNPIVRRALAYAINKNSLLETIYLGNATRAKTLIPPASWAYNDDINDTTYNPVLARKLLDEAGIKPGFTMTIWAHPLARDYNPDAKKMGELIKQYLSHVDINVEVVTSDWDTFKQQLSLGKHDSVLIGWSADNGDPDNFYRPLLSCDAIPSGTNRAMWCNQDYDTLIYSALQTDDIPKRQAIYQEVNRLLVEQLPIIPIAHSLNNQAYNKHVKGLKVNPYGAIQFGGVSKTK